MADVISFPVSVPFLNPAPNFMDPRPPGIPGGTVWTKTARNAFDLKPRIGDHRGEQEAKFIQDRITAAERNVAEFCNVFGAYSRKAARMRDKGDEVSRVVLTYAESEEVNRSLSNGLANFAGSMSTISDYADARVQNIDAKVVNEFSQYESICKHVKEEVKQIFSVRGKEVIRRRQFDRVRERNPRNRQQIIQAEAELARASAEVAKTVRNLEERVTKFERQKLHDIKNVLLDFISTEMGYHAKCLEILTKAYQDVNRIDEDSDLQDFQNVRGKMETDFMKSLRMSDAAGAKRRSLFRTSQSLGSLTTVFSTPKRNPSTGGVGKELGRKTSRSEEVLDSTRGNESDESESSSDSESDVDSENGGKPQEKISPFIARRFLK